MGIKYLISREQDGIYLKIEKDNKVLFPAVPEQILGDLAKRKIPFEPGPIETCFKEANGKPVKIAPVTEAQLIDITLLKVRISSDQLQAYLLVFPFLNGSKIDIPDIEKALEESKVKFGIKTDLFPQIVQQQNEYKEWLIAEGNACIDGEDAKLVFNFNPEGIDIKPQELADGSVDFFNLNLIQTVETGTVVAEKTPATPGINGITVHGEEKKARPGKDIRLPIGLNIQAVEENTKLIATKTGHIVYSNKKISVLPSYEVRGDVDFNTGNIKFPGNVVIYGNIKNNFEVEASGDIEIHGNLEGTAKTEGNLQVKKGIIRGKAVAAGNIYARYIENGYAESAGNIVITEAVMHSTTRAGKKVAVGGKKGLLVGGSCCAGEEISAKNIGSGLGTSTTLEVGIQPEARNEYKEVNRRLATLQEDYAKNDKTVKSLQEMKQQTGSLTGVKNELFLKICRLQYQIHREIEELKKRKMELEIQFHDMVKPKICVENSIHSGVNIVMGKSMFNVVEELYNVKFILDEYEIRHVPLRG